MVVILLGRAIVDNKKFLHNAPISIVDNKKFVHNAPISLDSSQLGRYQRLCIILYISDSEHMFQEL